MSFKYELLINGVKRKSVSKCWTSLLFMEIMKDIMRIDDMGKNKNIKSLSFKVTREE